MMKYFYLILCFSALKTADAQVAISTTPVTPAASAMLDIRSNNKGVLLPRIALQSATDVTTVANPETSLVVFNTATAGTAANKVTPGYYYWSGNRWMRMQNVIDTTVVSSVQGASFSEIPDAGGSFQIENFTSTAIPDNNPAGVTSNINIGANQLLTPDIYTLFIGVRIYHPYVGDLSLSLISPTGTTIPLSNRNGGSGDDYGTTSANGVINHTLFTADAGYPIITSGTPPFPGVYRPEGDLAQLNNTSAIGNWGLKIADQAGGDAGTLISWTILVAPKLDKNWYLVKEIPVQGKNGTAIITQATLGTQAFSPYGINTAITYSNTSSGPEGASGGAGTAPPGTLIQGVSQSNNVQGTGQSTQLQYFRAYAVNTAMQGEIPNTEDGTTYYIKLWRQGPTDASKVSASVNVTRMYK